MIDTNNVAAKPSRRSFGHWLFNPFRYVAGTGALVIGLAAIVVIGLLGWISNTHFDGVLDIHIGAKGPAWFFVAEGLIDWICLSLALIISGMLVARSRFRVVDLLGTQALSRWPGLIVVVILLISPFRNAFNRVTAHMLSKAAQAGAPIDIGATDGLLFGIVMLATLLAIIWTIILMYRAYSISCDIRGSKAIGSFVVSLIAAEVLSKVLLWQMVIRLGTLATELET